MIYLVTLNPAIDQYITVDDFKLNITNTALEKSKVFGGKAINVGKIVSQFIDDYQIITTIDSEHQKLILNETKDMNIKFFKNKAIRTNLKINNQGSITEINEKAKNIDEETKLKIKEYLEKNIQEEDYVLFAGSVSLDDTKYLVELAENIKTKNILLDVPTLNITDIEKIKPLMIKPNEEEIKNLFNQQIEIKEALEKLNKIGVKEAIITLGKEGAYFKNETEMLKVDSLQGQVVNTVGAGDSFVGGYLISKQLKYTPQKTLEFATICGSITAFSKGIAKRNEIEKLIDL